MNQNPLKQHLVEGSVTYDFKLHLRIGKGLWTLFFRLSQFHGHSSWLVCEVALSVVMSSSPIKHYFSLFSDHH
jgi:hypothetical protein